MNKLQKLGLERINQMLGELDNMIRDNVTFKLIGDKEKINIEKDVYPLNAKIREIQDWLDALNKEKQ
jgi:hypothetical protein